MLISFRFHISPEPRPLMFAQLYSAYAASAPRIRPWPFWRRSFCRFARTALLLSGLAAPVIACSAKKANALTDAGADAHSDGGSRDASTANAVPPPAFTAFVDAGVDNAALPLATGEELLQRMRHLLDAAAQNNPDLARDVVFPREAYLEVKDTKDPGKAWDSKVLAPFRRSMSHLVTRTKGIDKAKFVEFELGTTVVRSKARKHEYKCDLWHVKRSRIVFTIDGKVHRLDIAEMTSFRGAWYVSRL
jgi:hypothetical protein